LAAVTGSSRLIVDFSNSNLDDSCPPSSSR